MDSEQVAHRVTIMALAVDILLQHSQLPSEVRPVLQSACAAVDDLIGHFSPNQTLSSSGSSDFARTPRVRAREHRPAQ
jgi:hypothetical protein